MFNTQVKEIEIPFDRPKRRTHFLKGPIPWREFSAAACMPGKALAVFVAIHHRVALTGMATVTLPKALLIELGVSRDAKARALRDLEGRSLISVERASGRTARIRLLALERSNPEDANRPMAFWNWKHHD
jgi:hypothetical protein